MAKRSAKERKALERLLLGRLGPELAARGFAPESPRAGDALVRHGPEAVERIALGFTYSKYRIEGGTSPSVHVYLRTRFPELEAFAPTLGLDGCHTGQLRLHGGVGITAPEVEASAPAVLRGLERELSWFQDHGSLDGLRRDHRARPLPKRPWAIDDRQVLAGLLAARGLHAELAALYPSLHEAFRARLRAAFPKLELAEPPPPPEPAGQVIRFPTQP